MARVLPFFIAFAWMAFFGEAFSQGVMRRTFHDPEKKKIKEVYQVKDTLSNRLNGRYISYYLNGNIESKGQFLDNETTGIWEFFYETGALKMRGVLRQNSNFGLWEYFYESGQKSMQGTINGKTREGEWMTYYENGQLKEIGSYQGNLRSGHWKSYYEDGALKGETDYKDDFGRGIEYYHSGKVMAEGPKAGNKNVGHWRYLTETGTLQSEGDFGDGRKNGVWTFYFPSGKTASRGKFENDEPVGQWEYFFEDGTLASSGKYLGGKKNGYWKSVNNNGETTSEITYVNGTGEYKEYYGKGKVKLKGKIVNEKREGKWVFFDEEGRMEGECAYNGGKGVYKGYYPNGTLQTQGPMEEDRKVGSWEIFDEEGKLSGYYRPFYEESKAGKDIVTLATKKRNGNAPRMRIRKNYFAQRPNEYKGVIVGGNPVFMFAGQFPIGVEFYLQERLGHEFEFIGIREPFFDRDEQIPPGKNFQRGYSIAIKQKLYNPVKVGMWYAGHEFRFTNRGHFMNVTMSIAPDKFFTVNAVEQCFEWGPLVGYRLMQRNNAKGFTVDAFLSGNIGYRGLDIDQSFSAYFSSVNRSHWVTSVHFGLNFGKAFSFR